ncbi:rhomboid family intramembrane serine protease [Oceanicella actignis]|uniref:Membrane associated serine protease, rhomboid family n=1 Tax=Oceanicella actignis TaxID=1189325 RepID=A0A1M7TB30_9RHOB|nr:rhomboid family intramembrane serine protease [Oceanicella actignis]SET53141.1 Membrane associated serine protease, rhomboid family [Oceanicella actignis]SHN67934.1 Membrane associated serine protease, rhomboid family [Oceanicella actignis]
MFQLPTLPPLRPGQRPVLYLFAAVMAALELAFQLSDAGVLEPGLRIAAFRRFAFFDPWFDAWLAGRPAPPQTVWTLLTYAFLHGGATHFLMNCAAMLGLGLVTIRIFGAPMFPALFAVTAAGGALCFGLLSATDVPMVGASGVVFGLIGAVKYVEYIYVFGHGGGSRGAFVRSIGGLVAINLVLMVLAGGMLAWEAHLGGFLAGWAAAWAAAAVRRLRGA